MRAAHHVVRSALREHGVRRMALDRLASARSVASVWRPVAARGRLFQALYVRTDHSDPVAVPGRREFRPGSSRGRVYLLDISTGTVPCMGDVEARNAETVLGESDAAIGHWLAVQLGLAERRAIIVALRAAAPRSE